MRYIRLGILLWVVGCSGSTTPTVDGAMGDLATDLRADLTSSDLAPDRPVVDGIPADTSVPDRGQPDRGADTAESDAVPDGIAQGELSVDTQPPIDGALPPKAFVVDTPNGGHAANGIAIDGQGNVVMARAKGGVYKYGPSGQQLWHQPLESVQALAVDGQGAVYVTGSFRGTHKFGALERTSVSPGASDLYVCKLASADGVVEWVYTLGSGKGEIGRAMGVASNQQPVVGVLFKGDLTIKQKSHIGKAAGKSLILQLDASTGQPQWSFSGSDTSGWDGPEMMAMNTAGILIGGSFAGAPDFGGGPLTSGFAVAATYLLQLDNAGAHVWSKNVPIAVPSKLAIGASDAIYLAGALEAPAQLGGHSIQPQGATDPIVVKLDKGGNVQWATPITAAGSAGYLDGATAIFAGSGGNLWVLGHVGADKVDFFPATPGQPADKTLDTSAGRGFLAELSPAGRWLSAVAFGGGDTSVDDAAMAAGVLAVAGRGGGGTFGGIAHTGSSFLWVSPAP